MMLGMLWASIVRNQIAAIVMIFIVPGTLEGLGALLLKNNVAYLPYRALSNVIADSSGMGSMTPGKAAAVVMVYLVIGWAVSLVLLVRRDAN